MSLAPGATGIHKGVLRTHAKLVDSCRAAVYRFGHTPHSSTLNMFTTSFMGWYNLALPYVEIDAPAGVSRPLGPEPGAADPRPGAPQQPVAGADHVAFADA